MVQIGTVISEKIQFEFLYVHDLGPRSRNDLDLQYSHICIYNAITQNNREIDRVHKNELYIATVSIKQKAVDRIKTALQFWLNATRINAQMTSKTTTFVTSISAIVIERFANEQTDEKKMILQRNALSELRVNEVGFLVIFFSSSCIIK